MKTEIKIECGLIPQSAMWCPGGIIGAPCCYYCDRAGICPDMCRNHPDKCGKYGNTDITKTRRTHKMDMEEVRQMREDRMNGMKLEDVAEKYHVSVNTVKYRIRKLEGQQ